MKIVVDANVVMSALAKPSITREVLLYPYVDYYSPGFLIEEIKEHEDEISKKSGKGYKKALNLITKRLIIIPTISYETKMKEAERIIGHIDMDDAPYIALALSLDADGIWSYDEDMAKQNVVRIFSIRELLILIRRGMF